MNRLYYRGAYAITDSGIVGNAMAMTWNNDFLLAAQWQNGVLSGATQGTAFCSAQYTALDATTTSTTDSNTITSFSGKFKCTYEVSVKAGEGAPAVVLNTAKQVKWQFQWAEWEAGALTAG